MTFTFRLDQMDSKVTVYADDAFVTAADVLPNTSTAF